ncbi:Sugar phosphate permease [Paraburkholderia unamae]|uniref:MFS transporter n=1 Tax=Paraburkholderia unamae TaxID=219649 RepID=UPI001CB0C8C2|nr:MFS transporter [Paraburkholderia unamae]CAG9275015.1 Sugar phosphate permease [Paraburkholderia unamae]
MAILEGAANLRDADPGASVDATPLADGAAIYGALSARLDRLPATRAVWKLILLLSLGFFFELYDLLFTGYVAPGLVKSGILTSTTSGLFGTSGVASFIAALFCGLFLGTAACGFLADRFGRRAIFTWSLLWYVAANTVMAFQDTAGGLNFWRFLSGMGIGVELVTIGTYLSELAPKHLRGRAFAVCQTIGFSAVPVVAFLSWLLVPRAMLGLDGWRWVVLLGGVSALFVWYFRRNLPESPRWLASNGRLDEAEAVLADLEAKVARQYGAPLPAPGPSDPAPRKAGFADMWKPPYGQRTAMLIVFHIFQTVGFYGFANWVPTLLVKQGITVTSSLLYTTVIGLAAPLGPLLGYWIADRFERKHVIVCMAAVNIVSGLLFSQAAAAVTIVTLGVLLTLAGNIISFTYHTYQQELYPTAIRARAVGFVYSWSRLSAVFSSFVIAFTLREFGVTGVFVFIAGAMALVMVAIGTMGPRTLGKSLESISH